MDGTYGHSICAFVILKKKITQKKVFFIRILEVLLTLLQQVLNY